MKNWLLMLFCFSGIFSGFAFSETATTTPQAPSSAPAAVTASSPTVPVAAAAAPPQWAQELIATAEKLPVVGPILSKVLLWTGIVAGIMTTLVATLLGILTTLQGALNLAGVTSFAQKVAAFQSGKIMYWLKFFSLFNANPNPPTT